MEPWQCAEPPAAAGGSGQGCLGHLEPPGRTAGLQRWPGRICAKAAVCSRHSCAAPAAGRLSAPPSTAADRLAGAVITLFTQPGHSVGSQPTGCGRKASIQRSRRWRAASLPRRLSCTPDSGMPCTHTEAQKGKLAGLTCHHVLISNPTRRPRERERRHCQPPG